MWWSPGQVNIIKAYFSQLWCNVSEANQPLVIKSIYWDLHRPYLHIGAGICAILMADAGHPCAPWFAATDYVSVKQQYPWLIHLQNFESKFSQWYSSLCSNQVRWSQHKHISVNHVVKLYWDSTSCVCVFTLGRVCVLFSRLRQSELTKSVLPMTRLTSTLRRLCSARTSFAWRTTWLAKMVADHNRFC